uniref:Protein kinase domain-containing protein n=1 Tax=Chromera velia CCMP2878 TaxID=1169474 RepID=A0A0G4HTA3_9ALVE|eukprot:Cvel_31378.t1-p1 / transcript=Cvel_31378.t1 / gene=Cvel_31378 / organism=Chromera_velia_CCMP2878 / gene_product=hypothetical protein / transcript_product=hypothetical protein / location=Cvel_scaffold4665:3275-7730(-) / protein_length=486 / sequence_SO=supercontig / SO=protein_coding / is_pseudo=false
MEGGKQSICLVVAFTLFESALLTASLNFVAVGLTQWENANRSKVRNQRGSSDPDDEEGDFNGVCSSGLGTPTVYSGSQISALTLRQKETETDTLLAQPNLDENRPAVSFAEISPRSFKSQIQTCESKTIPTYTARSRAECYRGLQTSKKLGSGGWGEVKLVPSSNTVTVGNVQKGREYAIKVAKLMASGMGSPESAFKKETCMGQATGSTGIAPVVHDFWLCQVRLYRHVGGEKHGVVVMDLLAGNGLETNKILNKRGKVLPPAAQLGLVGVHEKFLKLGWKQADFKLDNVGFDTSGQARIFDFGIVFEISPQRALSELQTIVQTFDRELKAGSTPPGKGENQFANILAKMQSGTYNLGESEKYIHAKLLDDETLQSLPGLGGETASPGGMAALPPAAVPAAPAKPQLRRQNAQILNRKAPAAPLQQNVPKEQKRVRPQPQIAALTPQPQVLSPSAPFVGRRANAFHPQGWGVQQPAAAWGGGVWG